MVESLSSYKSRARIFSIQDLYSKRDNNINIYLSTFPANIDDKIFQNEGKLLFLGHFRPYFVVFAQTDFFLKNPAKYYCSGPPAFKCHSITISMQKSFNQSAQFIKSFVTET